METMHRTADIDALLDGDNLRVALYRCFSAYHDRPLFAIVERRRGRGSAVQRSNNAQIEGADTDKKKSKVQFATYMKIHRRSQYIRFSMINQLLLPKASKCGILCRSSHHAREVLCWELASVLGGFVLVLTDWDSTARSPAPGEHLESAACCTEGAYMVEDKIGGRGGIADRGGGRGGGGADTRPGLAAATGTRYYCGKLISIGLLRSTVFRGEAGGIQC
jgi:hypothetical protein